MKTKLSIKKLKTLRKNWLEEVKKEQESFSEYINYLYDGMIQNKPTFIKFYEDNKKEWEPEINYEPWEKI